MNATHPQEDSMTLFLNGESSPVGTLDQLRRHWPAVRAHPFAEIWLESPAGPALAILVNREVAFLMFLREEGDAGFTSRSPTAAKDGRDGREGRDRESARREFRLSNGQADDCPVSWTIPTDQALAAAEYFFTRGERAPWVIWREEGREEDSTAAPDA